MLKTLLFFLLKKMIFEKKQNKAFCQIHRLTFLLKNTHTQLSNTAMAKERMLSFPSLCHLT